MTTLEKPMLFSGPMVRAILEGRKSQTRRIVKPQPPMDCFYAINGNGSHALCFSNVRISDCGMLCVPPTPKSKDHRLECPHPVGSRIWVKETWGPCDGGVCYRASELPIVKPDGGKWKPSIFMPRWSSRIDLEVTAVKVERLQDISEEDARAEGCKGGNGAIPGYAFSATPREHYRHIWESINGEGSWDLNPWVWVFGFRRVKP